jgi:hypothetical protein
MAQVFDLDQDVPASVAAFKIRLKHLRELKDSPARKESR